MNFGRALWSLGSLLINGTIIIHLIMAQQLPAVNSAEGFAYVVENLHIYGLNWRIEWVLTAMIAAGAAFFATRTRKVSWAIIAVGQLLLLFIYPVLLTGYQAGSGEFVVLTSSIVTELFLFGNFIFLAGLGHLYIQDQQLAAALRYPAAGMATVGSLLFLACSFGLFPLDWIILLVPMFMLLQLINCYYGLIVTLSRRRSSRETRVSAPRPKARAHSY